MKHEQMGSPASSAHSIYKDALRGVRVLVVDDEPVLASTFCMVLKLAGAEPSIAENGRVALSKLQEQRFNIILCDKHMPVMTGPELIRELNARGDHTPVLLFVNNIEGEAQTHGLQIAGVLSKPLLPGVLIAAIQSAAQSEV